MAEQVTKIVMEYAGPWLVKLTYFKPNGKYYSSSELAMYNKDELETLKIKLMILRNDYLTFSKDIDGINLLCEMIKWLDGEKSLPQIYTYNYNFT
jgi:hypothetical protein